MNIHTEFCVKIQTGVNVLIEAHKVLVINKIDTTDSAINNVDILQTWNLMLKGVPPRMQL